ncbi:phosphoadenosine phosphosulfate reductase family protein [Actinomadura atramentaria]|uniref:phosphoadenosine phosphosulfate reductase family protein n=1 Tax=Actinomadura atramentaria TaxID=1990 RepID=UPI000380C07E|nr:phosphoadenosine phosphosulfate reductase family protein [Actinomadura atramentaria]
MSIHDKIAQSHEILDRAIADIGADGKSLQGILCLYSGGNDSTVLTHLMRKRATHVVHINTGIGVEETREFVRATTFSYRLPLIEEHPDDSYDDLVLGNVHAKMGKHAGEAVWRGFPGPAGHQFMYTRLKERALRKVRRRFIDQPRRQRLIFLAGMRLDESERRMRNANEIDREGSVVWVSPIVHWTDADMNAYRKHFADAGDPVPRNEVSDLLHMSGECLCGSFARPGELDEIDMWFPETADRIRDLERRAKEAGIVACKWGERPPKKSAPAAGRLCSSCTVPDEDHEADVIAMCADPAYTRAPEQEAA